MKNSVITDKELESIKFQYETQFFDSRFDFLNSHKGIRKGEYSLLTGPAGSGKSSLTRAIALDCADQFNNVMIHLSEEAASSWQYKFYIQGAAKERLERMYIFSELDDKRYTSVDEFFKIMEQRMLLTGSEIIIIDNITTSWIESLPVREKEDAYHKIKTMAKKYLISIFIVAHTKKDVDDNYKGLIQGEDIRGIASLYNYCPYAYVFQNFRNEHGFNPTVSVKKSRYHDGCANKWYALRYNKTLSTYTSDVHIDYETLNNLFSERFQLGKKKESRDDSYREQKSAYYTP